MTGVAGTTALTLFDKLPENLNPGTPMEKSTIYATKPDSTVVELASFYEQNRVPVTYEQISPVLYDAILSSEDKSFYTHGGVNLGATVKALVDNVRGTSSRGASTISQQFVKNVLIQQCEQDVDTTSDTYSEELQQCWLDATNAVGSKGIERKLQEMRYAIQIEKDYSKNDILLGYLNITNFGGTVYGIGAAAEHYFNTTAANLTIAQAATIAGMVQAPNTYRFDLGDAGTTVGHTDLHHGAARRDLDHDLAAGRLVELLPETPPLPVEFGVLTPHREFLDPSLHDRGRSGDVRGEDPEIRGLGRLRPDHQSDDRRRPGARGGCPGDRRGAS